MKLVLDSFAYKVVDDPNTGGCVLHLQPLDEDRTPDGIPVVVMIGSDNRESMGRKVSGTGVRPATSADLAKATQGIAGHKGRARGEG